MRGVGARDGGELGVVGESTRRPQRTGGRTTLTLTAGSLGDSLCNAGLAVTGGLGDDSSQH